MFLQKRIYLLILLFYLCFIGNSYSQTDTIKTNTPKKDVRNNPLFSSKSSSTGDTLADGIVLDNLPPARKPRNAIFGEIFTNGGLYSINYDRIIFIKKKIGMSTRTGVFMLPRDRGMLEGSLVIEPNLLIGSEKIFFETGFGFTRYIILEKQLNNQDSKFGQTDWENYFSFRAGFRMQSKKESGIFFRAGLTPVFYYMDSLGKGWFGQILGGIGFGASF